MKMEQARVRPPRPSPPSAETRHDASLDQKLRKISECYRSSMSHVNTALSADEQGNAHIATQAYVHALFCLEKGIEVELPQRNDSRCQVAWQQQAKMMEALENVRSRLYILQQDIPINEDTVASPAYSEDVPEGHHSSMFSDDQTMLNSQTAAPFPSESAVELLCIPGGVQLYCVDANSHVSAAPPSYPTSLRILLFDDQINTSSGSSRPPAFVQVGDWTYPLVPGQSPVLKCANGAYVFPDVSAEDASPQGSVGVVISSALDPTYREMYEAILENYSVLQKQEHAPTAEPAIDLSASVEYRLAGGESTIVEDEEQKSLTNKVVDGIGKGASWISWGLSKGAELTNSLIKRSATHIQQNLTPDENPTAVNPTLQKGLKYTNDAAKITYKVSGAMVKGLSAATSVVAKKVAPYVKSYAHSVLPSSATSDKNGQSTAGSVFAVAGAGIAGVGTVWSSLENAGVAIARAVSTATVDTVDHKYGAEAGQATKNITGAAVNFGRTAFNVNNLGIKAIAKRTAKDTGKTFLKSYVQESKSEKADGTVAGASDKKAEKNSGS